MTIELITGRINAASTIKTPPKADIDSGKEAPVKSAGTDDSVTITAMAQGLQKVLESASSATNVDVGRVAAVKKALADGSYPINAGSVAEKMLQYEKLMPQDNGI